MEDFNSPVFAQAKIEYTKQLIDVLKLPIYEGLQSIYNDSKQIYADNMDTDISIIFRKQIENVPKWNIDIIETEVDRIIRVSNCDWLEDLITAVFISHTKILASLGNNSKQVNLTIPKISNFIHKCYINIARELWKNPYLFDDNSSSIEYQQNIKMIENIIEEGIEQTIRKSLPVKELLRDHFENHEKNEQNNYQIEKTKKLQKILMNEIMEARKEKDDFINKPEQKYFDDHVNENMIQNNTKNLEINDILSDNEDEEIYENPNIISKPETPITVEEKLNEYKNIITENKHTDELIIKKVNNIDTNIDTNINSNINPNINNIDTIDSNINTNINSNIDSNIDSNINNDLLIQNDKIIHDDINNIIANEKINNIIDGNIGLKKVEVIENDLDETMTIDNFMNDVNELLTDKKDNTDFTLFNDAKEIES